MASTFASVLKFRDFRNIWLSQLTSQIALNMLNFALVLHIFTLTKSTTTISLVLIVSAIPSVIFGPFSGVFADRVNYKKILIFTNFLRFFAILLLFLAKNNVLAILEIIFLISTISQFFAPAELSSIPLIVPKKKLVGANTIIMTTMYGSLLIGYSIAGPLTSAMSLNGLYLACCLLYLLATLSVNRMTEYDKKVVRRISLSTWARYLESIWSETLNGIKKIRQTAEILNPMLKMAIGWMIMGSFIVLLPAFSQSDLKISTHLIGIAIIAPAGIGMLIGAYILDRRKHFNLARAINKSFFLVGVTILLFSLYRFYDEFFLSRLISLLLVIVIGLGSSVVYISAQTALHLNSDEEWRGRVFGINSMLINLAMSIPALIVGGIADLTSPFIALLLISFAVFIYGASLLMDKGLEVN